MSIKTLQVLKIAMILSLFVGVTSCQLTSLNDPTTEEGEEEERITGPSAIPTSIEAFEALFHGDSARVWTARTFEVGGFDGFQNCRLDDVITIKNDNTYSYDGGSLLCGAEDSEQFREGTWRVTNNGVNILFDEGTVREFEAEVLGFVQDTISVQGQFFLLDLKGIYISQ